MINRAQGTVEYLVIVAVLVVVSLVIVGIIATVFGGSSESVTVASDNLGALLGTGSEISIVDSVVDSGGNSIISLSNASGNQIRITSVVSGSGVSNYSDGVSSGSRASFFISGSDSSCVCSSSDSAKRCDYTINYTTSDGLAKSSSRTVTVDCVSSAGPGSGIIGLGSGALDDPWVINSCAELQEMNEHVDGNYLLGANIDCSESSSWNSGEGFVPVGDDSTPFTGSLNGNGNDISGLFINRPSESFVALLGFTQGSSVHSVSLTGVDITGGNNVGALVGSSESDSVIIGANASGLVSGDAVIGGLVGASVSSAVIDSYFLGIVSGSGIVGGLAGISESSSDINGSFAGGAVSGVIKVGGLIGQVDSSDVNNSFSDVGVSGLPNNAGGLIGHSISSQVSNSYSTGQINGGDNIGGLIGYDSSSSITNCFSSGPVYGNSAVGGIMGSNNSSTISSSYWFDNEGDDAEQCYASGDTGCTMQGAVSYFYDFSNAPIFSWGFPPWSSACGDSNFASLSIFSYWTC